MFRSDSTVSFETRSYTGSIQSNGFSNMDETSSQISSVSKPSAKSIYMQRMKYAASVNKMLEKFQYKVDHLFTCDLDGKDLRNISDCVERLKLLNHMGRVWGQNMLLEVHGAELRLSDIETKEELESISLSEVQELKAELDLEVFNSLLIVSVQNPRKRTTTIFMFQCDEVRADYVKKNLTRALMERKNDPRASGYAKVTNKKERSKDEVYIPPPRHAAGNGEYDSLDPELDLPPYDEEEEDRASHRRKSQSPQPSTPPLPPRSYTELDRNVDILNHIINDIELFIGKVAAIEAKNGKKKRKKKKGKGADGMPPNEEFAECLHKIKSGFNLLGELNGKISNPGAPDFVHSLFSALQFVVSHCSEELPPTIVAPLLIPQSIRLLSEEATTEEDQLWQSLGDAWNIPSTQWPEDDEDIPTYTLVFSDGWQPPEVSATPPPSYPESRKQSPRPAPKAKPAPSPRPAPSGGYSNNKQSPPNWKPPPPPQEARPIQLKLQDIRVKHNFISRNSRELTVRRGEMVELLDMSKQWWKVRNSRGEEGHVPNNVLEFSDEQPDMRIEAIPILTRKSKPPEVKAWLEDKGFSQITVRCLGVLSGSLLLGMSREELKMVCPEEGGRVFFQLQAVRSALADLS
ncbi:epidermal growth factor receptor kinase substrate 8-like protein 3 [Kryptolebias marmoratus]|uniref:EPS8 signaling adaptor L3a n=1 Tax=Kryptolebias marmoratus TaxID=37003 RepID=A0A3Q3BQF2_KRYMA|nr:epidermal growth factor receptor kinase substrate 8-like protein 3 [Kryptolebias marmoratus]